jgi:glycosyltransferase involved in cell wall biosynthesis
MKQKIIQIPRRFVKEKWGGTETVILETSKELIKTGYNVEIHTSLIFSNERKELIYGLPVIRYHYFYTYLGLTKERKNNLDNIGGSFYSIPFFFKLLFMKNIKLFHLHTMGRIGAFIRTISKLKKIPYIVSIHGSYLDMPKKELDELMKPTKGLLNWAKPFDILFGTKKVLSDADAIICVSQKESELMKKKYPNKKVLYLPNGVNISMFKKGNARDFRQKYSIKKSEKILLCVSRIDPQKNQILLIKAFNDLVKKNKKLRLVLIGAITNKNYYKKINLKIKEYSLKNKVLILNDINFDNPDLVNAYSAADIFILPSIHEPFGIVILEAWAAEKPVVASNIGGIPGFVEDGKTGLLFESESKELLNKTILKLLNNKKLTTKLAANGAKEVKKYSWNEITKKLLKLYKEVNNK